MKRSLTVLLVVALLFTQDVRVSASNTVTGQLDNGNQFVRLTERPYIEEAEVSVNTQEVHTSSVSHNYVAYEHVYSTLTSAQQSVYRKVVASIEANRNSIYQSVDFADLLLICEVDLSEYCISENEFIEVYWAICSDHVEYFFLYGSFYYYFESASGTKVMYIMASPYYAYADARECVYVALNNFLGNIYAGTSHMTNTAEKVRFVNESIENSFYYAYDIYGNPLVTDETSSIASVVNGGAVCGGYAQMFSFVCNQLSIPTIYVTGFVTEGYHAWDYVYISEEAKWYMCDATFSDGGYELLLKGKSVLNTHVPLLPGTNDIYFGYVLPDLAEEDYSFEDTTPQPPADDDTDEDAPEGDDTEEDENEEGDSSGEGEDEETPSDGDDNNGEEEPSGGDGDNGEEETPDDETGKEEEVPEGDRLIVRDDIVVIWPEDELPQKGTYEIGPGGYIEGLPLDWYHISASDNFEIKNENFFKISSEIVTKYTISIKNVMLLVKEILMIKNF